MNSSVTKITDHVALALDRLMEQYRGLPNFTSLISLLVQQIQDAEDAGFPLDQKRQLFDGAIYRATGAQLDGIGEIVGVKRSGLGDPEYLIFILGTIAKNFSDTTRQTMATIVNIFFAPAQIQIHEFFPAEYDIELATITPNLPTSLYQQVITNLQESLGAGVTLGFVSVFDPTSGFVCGDDSGVSNNGLGCGDDLDPSIGGMLASDIYTNSI